MSIYKYQAPYGDDRHPSQYSESYPMTASYNNGYNPGPSGPYASSQGPPTGDFSGGFGGDVKNPYEGERFKPKKRIKDPIFLLLFIAQVRLYIPLSLLNQELTCNLWYLFSVIIMFPYV